MAGILPYLAKACREARLGAHVRQLDIATRLDVSETTVGRFERGRHWPHRTDEIVAAYADEIGLPAVELWTRALATWGLEGGR